MRYGSISFTLSNLLSRIFSNLNTNEELERMIKFHEKHKELGTAKNVFKELIETVQTNSEYFKILIFFTVGFLINTGRPRF